MVNSSDMPQGSINDLAHSHDPQDRKEAASSLREQSRLDDEGFVLLKRLIKDNDENVSHTACQALGYQALRHQQAFDYMMELIAEDFFWVQLRGIWALGECA